MLFSLVLRSSCITQHWQMWNFGTNWIKEGNNPRDTNAENQSYSSLIFSGLNIKFSEFSPPCWDITTRVGLCLKFGLIFAFHSPLIKILWNHYLYKIHYTVYIKSYQMLSENPSMVWAGRDLKDHPVQTPMSRHPFQNKLIMKLLIYWDFIIQVCQCCQITLLPVLSWSWASMNPYCISSGI